MTWLLIGLQCSYNSSPLWPPVTMAGSLGPCGTEERACALYQNSWFKNLENLMTVFPHIHTHTDTQMSEGEVLLELSGDFFQIRLSSWFSFPPLLLNSGSVTLIHPIFKSSYDTISLHCSVSSVQLISLLPSLRKLNVGGLSCVFNYVSSWERGEANVILPMRKDMENMSLFVRCKDSCD